jgi:DNA-binding XRE family transcriptional regulator
MKSNLKRRGRREQGRGPVFEIRKALEVFEGRTITQEKWADRIGVSVATVCRCEKQGVLPQSKASRSLLLALAPPLISEEEVKALMKSLSSDHEAPEVIDKPAQVVA